MTLFKNNKEINITDTCIELGLVDKFYIDLDKLLEVIIYMHSGTNENKKIFSFEYLSIFVFLVYTRDIEKCKILNYISLSSAISDWTIGDIIDILSIIDVNIGKFDIRNQTISFEQIRDIKVSQLYPDLNDIINNETELISIRVSDLIGSHVFGTTFSNKCTCCKKQAYFREGSISLCCMCYYNLHDE